MHPISKWLSGPRPYDAGVALYIEHGTDPILKKALSEPRTPFKEQRLVKALQGLVSAPEAPKATIPAALVAKPQPTPPPADDTRLDAVVDDLATTESRVDDIEMDTYTLRDQVEQLSGKVTKLEEHAKAKHRNGWPVELDATLQALYDQWKPLFVERMTLMATIYDVAKAGRTDTEKRLEAGKIAHRILDLRDRCIELYEQRDHYIEHGKLPVEPVLPDLATDLRQFPKKLANHERYRRDYKSKLEALLKHDKPDAAKVAQLQANIQKQEQYITWYKKQLGDGTV